jgi:hypothetical protein
MKRHNVLFLISFILVAIAVILAIVLTVQVRRLSYNPISAEAPVSMASLRTTSTIPADGIPR